MVIIPRTKAGDGVILVCGCSGGIRRETGFTWVSADFFCVRSGGDMPYGKIERWHGSLKRKCIRPGTPLSLEDAQRLTAHYIEHYNNERPYSAIGYVAPKTNLKDANRKFSRSATENCKRPETNARQDDRLPESNKHDVAYHERFLLRWNRRAKRRQALLASNLPRLACRRLE